MNDAQILEHVHHFDRHFVHDGLKRDIRRRLGLAFGVILAALVAYWLFTGVRLQDPETLGLLGMLVVVTVVATWWGLRRVVDRTYAYWERLSPDRVIRYRIGPEAMEVEMPHGTGQHTWKGMRRLWRYRDIWLLEIVKNTSVLFPADAPEPIRDYVVERCREAGVRV